MFVSQSNHTGIETAMMAAFEAAVLTSQSNHTGIETDLGQHRLEYSAGKLRLPIEPYWN